MIYNQFYSNNNISVLKKIINEDLESKYNIKNANINSELQKCMKYVKDNVSSQTPNNISNDEYLALMNKKVYKLVTDFYKNENIDKKNHQILNRNIENKVHNESSTIQDKLFDNEIIKNYKNNDQIIDYPKPSFSSNLNIDNHTEKLKKERELIYPEVKEIKFNDEEDKSNNTMDLYNDLLTTYNSQVNDLEKFENNQSNMNDSVNQELSIIEDSDNSINKLTPINSLNNIEEKQTKDADNIVNYNDSVYDFQNFLKDNKNELIKDNVKPSNKIENNSSSFSNKSINQNILLNKPKYEQSTKTDYIIIDSRYRDFSLYPNQCDFVFKFSPSDNNFIFKTYSENDIVVISEKKIVIGNQSNNDISETFDNINSVYLDNVIVPVHSFEFSANQIIDNIDASELTLTIYKDSYLLLEIPELRSPYKGGNTNFKKAFAVLRINHGSSLTAMKFSNNFTNLIVPNEVMVYEPSPLGKLDKFSIKLNNKNGRIYNFGIDKLYIKNFSKGELKYLGICGKQEYSTKFEINRSHIDYSKICKNYYNIKDCDTITNNPLIIRDLIYFYHIVPNENEMVFFENNIKIDVFKKNVNNIKLSLSYKVKNKKINVNIINLLASFKTINEDLSNYYFIIIISGQKYYLRIKEIDENYLYLYSYTNLPNFNKNNIKFGLSKGNKSGSNNDRLESLFYSSGFNVISVNNAENIGDTLGSYTIEIDYPYDNLPNFIKENNFTDDDLFIIQDKKQISYGFTIKYNIKDHEELNSYLNESGHN